jgi:hypothetical protein
MTFQSRIASATRRAQSAEASPADQTRRWAKRKSVYNSAQIIFDGVTTPYACLVRDISSTGARLEMSKNKFNPDGGSSFLPTYFTLIMPLDRTRVECQSMWRRGSFIGARFMGAVEQMPAPKRSMMVVKKK